MLAYKAPLTLVASNEAVFFFLSDDLADSVKLWMTCECPPFLSTSEKWQMALWWKTAEKAILHICGHDVNTIQLIFHNFFYRFYIHQNKNQNNTQTYILETQQTLTTKIRNK